MALIAVSLLLAAGGGWWLAAEHARPLTADGGLSPATRPARFQAPEIGPADGEIEYVYPDQSVWTTRMAGNGAPDNPLLVVAADIFAAAGLSWRAVPYPAARMFSQLQKTTTAFSILVRSPALDACCVWGRTLIARTELRAYHLPEVQAIRARNDMIGKRVAIIRGYGYGGLRGFLAEPANRITVSSAGNHDAAFGMLQRGHADYVLDYAGPASEILAGLPALVLQFEVVDTLDVFMVLSRGYPDAEATMVRLDAIAAVVVGKKSDTSAAPPMPAAGKPVPTRVPENSNPR